MNHDDRTSHRPEPDYLRFGWNLFHAAMLSHVCLPLVLLRKPGTMGRYFVQSKTKGTLLWMAFFSLTGSSMIFPVTSPMIGFLGLLGVFLLALSRQQLATKKAQSQGEDIHSYWVGESLLWRDRWGFRDRRTAERFWEPLACVGLGLLVFPFLEPLGLWLLTSPVSLLYVNSFLEQQNQALKQKVTDAKLEQQNLSSVMGRKR